MNKTNLTATTKLVLMALVQHYNANNADMFPSQKFLAKQLGISEKSVERSIANLKNEEYIYYVTKKVNRYRFTAKFFEQIKMSVMNRQNVGNDVRQNVGQTNNMEKINKKDYFLNFGEEIFSQKVIEISRILLSLPTKMIFIKTKEYLSHRLLVLR